jgi:hypothetical protein
MDRGNDYKSEVPKLSKFCNYNKLDDNLDKKGHKVGHYESLIHLPI